MRGSVAYKETEMGENISKVVPKPTLINPRATLSPNHVAETGPRLITPLEAETPEKQPHD